MTASRKFIKGDCAVVYECMSAHEDGISITDISRETGLEMCRVKGCAMRLANSGMARIVDKSEKVGRWKTI